MKLHDDVALVTGAGRGIGRAIAQRLSADGAKLVLVDLNGDNLAATARAIRETGSEVLEFVADVADSTIARSIIDETISHFGRLDILVSNAANTVSKSFLNMSIEEWNWQINLNLSAPFYFAHPAATAMSERGYGRIIFIGSATGLQGPIDQAAYGAAKAGVNGLVRAMALELGEYGITTNCVAPGPINTELMREFLTPEQQRIAALRIPARRVGEPREVADAVAFLATRDAAFVNGATISVDGGFTAGGGFMAEMLRRRLIEP